MCVVDIKISVEFLVVALKLTSYGNKRLYIRNCKKHRTISEKKPASHLGCLDGTGDAAVAQMTFSSYPLVNVHITMDNHHLIDGKSHHFDWAIFNCYLKLPEGTNDIVALSTMGHKQMFELFSSQASPKIIPFLSPISFHYHHIIPTGGGPPVVSWFIILSKYSYIYDVIRTIHYNNRPMLYYPLVNVT